MSVVFSGMRGVRRVVSQAAMEGQMRGVRVEQIRRAMRFGAIVDSRMTVESANKRILVNVFDCRLRV
jgi:hypothetical protein